MRYIVFLFILFSSCQKEVSATLMVNVKPNDTSVKTTIFLYESKLYKETKLYKKIPQPQFPYYLPQVIKIDSLKKGKYTFEYPDLYGDFIRQEINIEESKTYQINIYPDITKKLSKKNIISSLKNGEDVEIKLESRGCFHSSSIGFHISKKNNQLEIRQEKRSKILNPNQEKYLIDLENRTRLLENGGCTTSERIIFILKNKSDTITDSGCQLHSLSKFLKVLKIK